MKPLSGRNSVLIVDDTDINIDILAEALESQYDIRTAMDGESALVCVAESVPDIILLDIVMPGMSGFDVCTRLKSDPATADVPIIFLTAMTDINDKVKGFEMGAVDYMVKPFAILEVQARLNLHLSLLNAKKALKAQNELLEVKVQERTQELAATQDVIVEAMASLAETRDPETGDHVMRTRYYVQALAEKLKNHTRFVAYLGAVTPAELGRAAILHDIGKVGVPDGILLKPGRLTPEEYNEIKKHATYGHEILKKLIKRLPKNTFLRFADDIAWGHHEKWDGAGYPRGLKGDEIPLPARLMAIADVYDALISPRVYKPAMSHEETVEYIVKSSGTHFDPDVVKAFFEINETFRYIASELTGETIGSTFILEDVLGPCMKMAGLGGSLPGKGDIDFGKCRLQ